MNRKIETIIKSHWEEMVDQAYFYRGMSLSDLDLKSDIVLDPKKNHLQDTLPLFVEYSEFLLHLIAKGLRFEVNDFYVEPLQKVLNWTIRDIKNSGIDFTTNYADAASYAFNYAGSQIKHNFNLITKTIHKCKVQACFNKKEKQKFLAMTKKMRGLLKREEKVKHQPVVIKVKRSCQAFQSHKNQELNVGSYEFFLEHVIKEAKKNDDFSLARLSFFLHQRSQTANFNVRPYKSLHKADIAGIIIFK